MTSLHQRTRKKVPASQEEVIIYSGHYNENYIIYLIYLVWIKSDFNAKHPWDKRAVELYAEEFCICFAGMENYDIPKSTSSSNYDIPRSSAGEGSYDVPRSYENLTKADDEFEKIQDVPGDVSL